MSSVVNRNSGSEPVECLASEVVRDVSGKTLEFDVQKESSDEAVEDLYLYKNEYTLLPSSVRSLGKLRTLKFFGNEVRLFPVDGLGSLLGLENLQVKISPIPGVNGLELYKFKSLKELELSCLPQRPSVITILNEISELKCLTKLSVCHFSIRYLPPEIGCLKNLEFLDLSFNKLKFLPSEVGTLSSLVSLRVSHNKLVQIPPCLSTLKRLERLDLSNNRLTTLGSLDLKAMPRLKYFNLQLNQLKESFDIPEWMYCNLEGNAKYSSDEENWNSLVEMDVYETSASDSYMDSFCEGSHHSYPSPISPCLLNTRNISARRPAKRWKRRQHLQQRARQERLNSSRKWKCESRSKLCKNTKNNTICESSSIDALERDLDEPSDGIVISAVPATEDEYLNSMEGCVDHENSTCVTAPCNGNASSESSPSECSVQDKSSEIEEDGERADEGSSCSGTLDCTNDLDDYSYVQNPQVSSKSKRHCIRDLENPKPSKFQKPSEATTALCKQYNELSFCSVEDRLPDGFYDAGRGRPFMELKNYEESLCINSREVILLDRGKDEVLDAITLSALSMVSRLKKFNNFCAEEVDVAIDNLQIASWLALFVSDHFGGSERGYIVEKTRKSVSGSNYDKPFFCTCSSGNSDKIPAQYNKIPGCLSDFVFSDLTEKSLQSIKGRLNSVVVPIGVLQFGICRHRALLLKYLCDRMNPPIPCELVRGYLDFYPHSWNVILVKRNKSFSRMIVDACSPHDIREETDPEYFCRYIPLNRINIPVESESMAAFFPPLVDDIKDKSTFKSVVRCKLASLEAAAKVRSLEIIGRSEEDIQKFEYSFIGEVRILGTLSHPSIVKMYGHQIFSKWVACDNGAPDRHLMFSAIYMEYIDGGSLKEYIESIFKSGKKQVCGSIAVCIARDVASALMELHSKHIIHRDIKSANILVNLDEEKPVVKLCDFDMAVPLRSPLHKCCISHKASPPPHVCVGTPRWMAPEVLRAMKDSTSYGLEVDIWSYGCLLAELLTLQIPYFAVPEDRIHELIEAGERPRLTDELEAMASSDSSDDESTQLRFLVDLYRRCTDSNPAKRPSAADIYETFIEQTSS